MKLFSLGRFLLLLLTCMLIVNCNNGSNLIRNTKQIGVEPVSTGGILVMMPVTAIDTAVDTSLKGTLTVINAGNSAVTDAQGSYSDGLSSVSGCENTTINAGESCTISFKVSQYSGSARIKLSYTGSAGSTSVTQIVNWFNSKNGTVASMNYTNSIILPTTTTITTEEVVVTNFGGYTLSSLTIAAPQTLGTGLATATISYPSSSSCQNATLDVGKSCSYILNINGNNAVETYQQIITGFSASYNNGTTQSYNRYAILNYSTAQVNISSSLSSSADVTQGESFTITASYNNVDATVSFANESSNSYITYNPTSCAVSSTTPTCTSTVSLAGNTPVATYTTAITASNQAAVSPSTINFSATSMLSSPLAIAINPAGTYAFISVSYNGGYSIATCGISGATLTNCFINTGVTGLSTPTGIALNSTGTQAFIVNKGNTTISTCAISGVGVLSDCVNTGASQLSEPFGIAISGSYAYITTANASSTSTSCIINSDYSFSSCSHQSSTEGGLSQSGITLYNNRIYMVYGNLQGYFNAITCAINGTSISSCAYPNLGYSYNNYGIAITPSGAYVFIVNSSNSSVSSCSISSGALSNCSNAGG